MSAGKSDLAATAQTVGAMRRAAVRLLPASDSAALDIDLLLTEVLACTRAHLLAHPEQPLSCEQQARFDALLVRRARAEPIAYLLGHKEFFGLSLAVSPAVLIPRPDTETLVTAVLDRCDAAPRRVLDLGTGSGAIALSLAEHRSNWQLIASDCDAAALRVAWDNCLRFEAVQVRLLLADWSAAYAAACADVIVSNPPYVGINDTVDAELRYEPQGALFAGRDGLDAIRVIVADAPRVLRAGGWLMLEHGHRQGAAVRALLRQAEFSEICTQRDLANHGRVTCGRKP